MAAFNLGNISNSHNTGTVSGTSHVGGVAGQNNLGSISNVYYLDTSASTGIGTNYGSGTATAMTAEQFASGEVAYLLQGEQTTQIWGQNIDNGQTAQSVPALYGTKVYQIPMDCAGTLGYSNTNASKAVHSYSDDGFCTNKAADGSACDAYEPAILVTADNRTELGLAESYVGYYAITNAGQLYWFAEKVDNENATYGSANVVLTKDITINEGTVTAESTGMRAWNPIGWYNDQTANAVFGGIFDGNSKTVSGLYFNNTNYYDNTANYTGLVAYLTEDGIVKDLTVTNSCIQAGRYGGAIAGYSYGTITGCVNHAAIETSTYAGGIVGWNKGTVELCGNTGTVSAWAVAGGIAGYTGSSLAQTAGVITNCWNTGSVSAESHKAGGIAGENAAMSSSAIRPVVRNCWSTGTVTAPDMVGGVTGDNWYSKVINSYSTQAPVGQLGEGAKTDKAEQKTLDQFTSGEVAYLLNGDQTTLVWGQSLDNGEAVNTYPVFKTDTNTVYKLTNCDGNTIIYSNSATITTHQDSAVAAESFKTDENGNVICATCGAQAKASLTTAGDTPVVTYYTTLEEAVAAAQNASGSTVKLLDSVQLPATLNITAGNFTIDLNGKTISNAANASFEGVTMIHICGANVEMITIDDTSAEKTGTIISDHTDSISKPCTIVTRNKLTVKNGIIKQTAGGYAINAAGSAMFSNKTAVGWVVVENGTFVGKVNVYCEYLDISGGSFETLEVYKYRGSDTAVDDKLTGGSFNKISVLNGASFADCIAADYYYYGADGKIINVSDVTEITNVTVKKGASLYDATVTLDKGDSVSYNGTEQKPTVTVTIGGLVVDPSNYTVKITNLENDEVATDFTNPGDFYIWIEGNELYSGNASKEFRITRVELTADDFTVVLPSGDDAIYSGQPIVPEITYNGTNPQKPTFTVEYYLNGEKPVDAGTYVFTIKITEDDYYYPIFVDSEDWEYSIAYKELTKDNTTVTLASDKLTYNGQSQLPTVTQVKLGDTVLVLNTDYTIFESYAKDVDTYELTINGRGNYTGSVNVTFEIVQATPTLTAESPVTALMPGNTILLSYTLIGENGEDLTNSVIHPVSITSAKVGNLTCTVDGMKITVPADAVIGDELVVTFVSAAGLNYTASETTLTLDIGTPDYSKKIAELEADIAELNKLIAEDGEIDKINTKINEINNKIALLEAADITNKAELEGKITAVKNELADMISDLEAKLDEKVNDLQEQITSNDTDIADIVKTVTDINGLIDALEAADVANKAELEEKITAVKNELTDMISDLEAKLNEKVNDLQEQITSNDTDIADIVKTITDINGLIDALEAADVTNKTELEGKITAVKNELTDMISALEAKLDEKVNDLQEQITSNDTDIADINESITAINGLIDALKAADKALGNDISKAITKAEKELKAAQEVLKNLIADVQTNLDNAKAELDKAIADGDTALDEKITALKEALEAANNANKTELTSKIDEAYASLDAAIKAVQKNLDDLKVQLEAKDADLTEKTDELQTFIIIVCVISCVAFVGCATLSVIYFIDKKKKS